MNPTTQDLKSRKIRVLLVDDSPVAINVLKKMLSTDPGIQVVGTAANGQDALELVYKLKPDVLCTDLHMPKMGGYELTKKVMMSCPMPILVISISFIEGEKSESIFNVLSAGAVDVFPKCAGWSDADKKRMQNDLVKKIRVISGVVVFSKFNRPASVAAPLEKRLLYPDKQRHLKIIAIGSSTGGPVALLTILRKLPCNFPLPIICIQHISKGFLSGLVEWLESQCSIKVRVAQHNELPLPGIVYFAPEDTHLEINHKGMMTHSDGIDGFSRLYVPSITLTFQSIAKYYGNTAAGILLTGMGNDGAEGLKEIFDADGFTIAQDEKSCVVYGMPCQAVKLGAVRYSLSIDDIANYVSSIGIASVDNDATLKGRSTRIR